MIKYDNLHFFVKIRRTIRRKGQKTGFLSPFFCAKISSKKNMNPDKFRIHTIGCGGRTRTSDLWVMSPTSCQLLYPAILNCFHNIIILHYKKKYVNTLTHFFVIFLKFLVNFCLYFLLSFAVLIIL